MISLIPGNHYAVRELADQVIELTGDPWFRKNRASVNVLMADGTPAALEIHTCENRIVQFHLRFFADLPVHRLKHIFWNYEETLIRTYQPLKLLAYGCDAFLTARLKENLYYAKGRSWMRILEPWRLQMSDLCFDDEGFIIDQGRMESIPFGWFNTKDKGCGWIAAYNLLKLNGRTQPMQKVAESLGRRAVMGAIAGEAFSVLYVWLRQQGMPVSLTLPGNRSAEKAMLSGKNGILLYTHRNGLHYVLYENLGNGRMHFFNAVYGRKMHIEEPGAFIRKNCFLPLTMVICVK
ncbi:MAG: hypothetical protein IKG15_01255 [Solobacterium sp.]|nr:hypothetical protein [Solobacterium sp.]